MFKNLWHAHRKILLFCSLCAVLIVGRMLLIETAPVVLGDHDQAKGFCAILVPAQGLSFIAQDQTGHEVQVSDWIHDPAWRLVFFGYTYCPTICPAAMQVMHQVLRIREQADVQQALPLRGVFVSLDPDNDTVERLSTFLQSTAPSVQGLRGSLENIQNLLQHFHVYKGEVAEADGNIPHTGHFFLLDPALNVRALWTAPLESGPIAQDIDHILKQDALCP